MMRQVRVEFGRGNVLLRLHDDAFAGSKVAVFVPVHENQAQKLAIFFDDLDVLLGVIIKLILKRAKVAGADAAELVNGKRDVGDKGNQAHGKEGIGIVRRWDLGKGVELRKCHGEHCAQR